jgi:hypothetical protein
MRDDIPKEALPDNSSVLAEYQKGLGKLAIARNILAQATATKLPSKSMASLRQQIAAANKAKCE